MKLVARAILFQLQKSNRNMERERKRERERKAYKNGKMTEEMRLKEKMYGEKKKTTAMKLKTTNPNTQYMNAHVINVYTIKCLFTFNVKAKSLILFSFL